MNQLVFNLKLNVSQYIREAGAKLRLEEMGRGCYLFNHKELQDTTFSSMSVVIWRENGWELQSLEIITGTNTQL